MAATTSRNAELALDANGKFLGAAGAHPRQHGRLSLDLRALRADLPLRHAAGRRVHDAGDLLRGEGGLHQHRAGRRLSRRRPAGGDLPARAPDGRRGAGDAASTASRSAGATSSRPTPSPTRRRSRCSTTAATTTRRSTQALETADWAGFEARRAEAAKRGKLRGIGISTYLEACGIAPSAVVGSARRPRRPLRGRHHPRASDRQRHGADRRAQPRPGPRDDLRAAGRRPARRADRAGRHRARRHRQGALRHGHLRLALARGRRLGDGQGDGQDHRQGQEDRRPPDGGLGRRHRVRPRHLPRRRHRQDEDAGRDRARPPTCRTTTRSTRSSPASRRPPSTTRRTSPIPAAATSPRSRSTPRPARSQW